MRFCIIEPNLKAKSGHVYTGMKEFLRFFKNNCYDYFLICHKHVSGDVVTQIPAIYPMAEVSCFETNNWQLVEIYLLDVIKQFCLSSEDIIIMPSANINEIIAAKEISNLSESAPRFILQLHQFYPPLNNADDIGRPSINRDLERQFAFAFSGINWKKMVIATTQVKKLNIKLSSLAHHNLFYLPVPFDYFEMRNRTYSERSHERYRIGFVGDGRKEKGLLKFLQSIDALLESICVDIYINYQPGRCYPSDELNLLKDLLDSVKIKQHVHVIDGLLDSQDYYDFIAGSQIMVLPYHPDHYSIRLSGIACECGGLGIPVVTCLGTSISEQIQNGNQVGISFQYSEDTSVYNKNILYALSSLIRNYNTYRSQAISLREEFLEGAKVEKYFYTCLRALELLD